MATAEAVVEVAVVAAAGEVAGGAAAAEAVMVALAQQHDQKNCLGAVQGCPNIATMRAMVSRHRSCEEMMVSAANITSVGGNRNGIHPQDHDRDNNNHVDACNNGGKSNNRRQHRH
jgi:hypothetical protein